MAQTEENTPTISTRFKQYFKEAPFFCKIIEVIFCVISVGLIIDPFNDQMQQNLNHAGMIYVSICGYIMINLIVIICYLYGEKMNKTMALVFSGLGAIMCFAAGVILIYDWKNFQNNYISRYYDQYLEQMLASGIFAILAAFVFAIETYIIYKQNEIK
ncbi:uncharacterized protein [Chelonus insularis]|uniref:uncharacterized protein n=1 Tax=Chelonus insularis TaxID=460826 RepID=UPI00158934B3|nr:uncharacterized protein LOC118072595 [Chelonus insularis]